MERRRSRFAAVQPPRREDAGGVETLVFVLYDIPSNRVRLRIASACLDFGLERIQWSAFRGVLTSEQRGRLIERLVLEIGSERGRLHVVPVCAADAGRLWALDQLQTTDDRARRPALKVLAAGGQQRP